MAGETTERPREGSGEPGAVRRATVYDVARAAEVSIATVSFAFRRPDSVKPSTRERVLAAARALGYAPSGAARGLAAGRTGVFGLHSFDLILDHAQALAGEFDDPVPELDLDALAADGPISFDALGEAAWPDPRAYPLYVDEVQRGFELESRRLGREVLLSRGSSSATAVADTAGRVDGLAVFPTRDAPETLRTISRTMPVVLLSAAPSEDDHHRVLVDNMGGMQTLIAHLIDDHGIRDLGFVGSIEPSDAAERFRGMGLAMAERGLTPPEAPIDSSTLAERDSLARVAELAAQRRLPRALVCTNDQLALVTMEVLRGAGLDVPTDVAVTGFDGVLAGRLSTPTLTTVRQPLESMGRIAARILAEEYAAPSKGPRRYRLGTRLEIRASCGCA